MKTLAEITSLKHHQKKHLHEELEHYIVSKKKVLAHLLNDPGNLDQKSIAYEIAVVESTARIIESIKYDEPKKNIVTQLSVLINDKKKKIDFDNTEVLQQISEEVFILKSILENVEWDCLTEIERGKKYAGMQSIWKKW